MLRTKYKHVTLTRSSLYIANRSTPAEGSIPPYPRPSLRLGDRSDGERAYALHGRYIRATTTYDGQGRGVLSLGR